MTQTSKNTQPMMASAPVMLVTGSAKRIGAAIVRAAHKQGYRVIIHCHHSEQEAYALADVLNDTCAHSAVVIVADLAVVNQADTLKHLTQTIMRPLGN